MLKQREAFNDELNPRVYRFEGILTSTDRKKYYEYSFEVYEDVNRITIELRYNEETGNIITTTVFDPCGFRGRGAKRSKRNAILMDISNNPTPGVVPGAIVPGKWILEVEPADIYGFCLYEIVIKLFRGSGEEIYTKIKSRETIINPNAGWYKGELHLHSIESDGIESVSSLISMAEEEKLDYIAITDHNTVSQWSKFVTSDTLAILKGIELSTYNGHANVYGVKNWIDWRVGYNGLNVDTIIDLVHQEGGIISINHPCTPSLDGHLCWSHDTDYSKVDAIEIWNAPWLSLNGDGNKKARKLWDKLLNKGYKIAGIGGSDLHQIDGILRKLGKMLTYIYCDNLSNKSIIDGIKKCKAFVTMGPYIDFTIENETEKVSIGDSIGSGIVKLNIIARDIVKGNDIVIVKDGEIEKKIKADKGSVTYEYTGNLQQGSWYRIEIYDNNRNENDELIAITNPIWGR